MKKVGKYLLILLLLLTGLFFIALLFLFFVPNSSLFGITYVGKNTVTYSQSYNVNNFSTINLNSNAFDINIVPTDLDQVYLKVTNKMFGFTLEKNSKVILNQKLYKDMLTFSVTEPHGAAFKNGSTIELRIPENSTLNLNINNNSASVNFKSLKGKSDKDAKIVHIKNLEYNTKKGSLQIANASVSGNINLNLNSGSCNILKSCKLNNNNLTLSQTSGRLTTEKEVILGDITHQANTSGNVNIYECNSYTANLGSAGGNISLGITNGDINISSSDTNINIDQHKEGGATINLTKSGKIYINKATSANRILNLNTNSGNISVGESYKNILATSNNGNIKISQMRTFANLTTNSGNISVTYATDASDYTEENSDNRKADIKTTSGNVTVDGVENITLTLNKGSAVINMKKVLGLNNLTATSGSIKVVTPSNLNVDLANTNKYLLTTKTEESGTVFVGISGFDEHTKKEQTTLHVGVKPGESLGEDFANTLNVSATNGSVRVVNAELDY